MLNKPVASMRDWLRSVPVSDPVDRRNAPMFQIVLLLFVTLPPMAWLYRGIAVPVPWREGELASLGLSLLFSAVCLLSFWLIRTGRFRWATYQLLAVFAISVCASYAASGFTGQRFEQPILAVPLAIAALALGRAALWSMFLSIMLAFAIGVRADARSFGIADTVGDGVISAVIFLLLAIVMDRTSAALRQSLRESQRYSEQMRLAHDSLEHQIEERRRVEDHLVNTKKVKAVARLALGLNHDFNHLLSLVSGYARQARKAPDAQAREAALDGIDAAARRAQAVSQKLLNFTRQGDERPQLMDLAKLVDNVLPLLKQAAKPSVKLVSDIPAGLRVWFDPHQLELILLNMVTNADDAMAQGGTIQISAAPMGDGVRLRCADTGGGIPMAIREKIFEPFFTTKPEGGGTGLGLAMAKGLMERHAGRIWLDDSTEVGSAFLLEFSSEAAHLPSPTVEEQA